MADSLMDNYRKIKTSVAANNYGQSFSFESSRLIYTRNNLICALTIHQHEDSIRVSVPKSLTIMTCDGARHATPLEMHEILSETDFALVDMGYCPEFVTI